MSGQSIHDFLLARIAEDEAEAKELGATAWYDGGWSGEHEQRLLADCAAKRVIIAERYEDHEDSLTRNDDTVELGSVVLFALAAVYSDHPDYRQEWTA